MAKPRRTYRNDRAAWTAFITGKACPKPPKYGNERVGGFDSKHEAEVGANLAALERGGKIRDLQKQVRFVLVEGDGHVRGVTYRADFTYNDDQGFHVLDAKSKGTRMNTAYRIRKRLMWLLRKIEIEEV